MAVDLDVQGQNRSINMQSIKEQEAANNRVVGIKKRLHILVAIIVGNIIPMDYILVKNVGFVRGDIEKVKRMLQVQALAELRICKEIITGVGIKDLNVHVEVVIDN